MFAGKSRVEYMREYRKRKRLKDDNSQSSNNVSKRRKTNAEYMREYRKSHVDKQPTKSNAEYMREYRKRKAQEKTPQASTSTHPTPTPIIYSYNQANTFKLDVLSDLAQGTTRSSYCIDMVFGCNVDKLSCMNYVSYFSYLSYHKPILSTTNQQTPPPQLTDITHE
jgi:hypothetical protein